MPCEVRYEPWSQEVQAQALSTTDGVVIPVELNPFTACKTHNRLTTALYAGVPVVATAIDSYREFAPFCRLDDWDGGLHRLRTASADERSRAAGARAYIDSRWSAEAIVPLWEQAVGLEPPL